MGQTIKQAVILAAGQGTRLRRHEKDYVKPLYPLAGRPLISYVFENFLAAGVETVNVVVGFHKDELVPGMREAVPAGLVLRTIDNPDWRLSNGVSLLKAKGHLHGRFFLSMSDHLFETSLVRALQAGAEDPGCLYLAVDRKLGAIFDMDDATKVKTEQGMINDIGKNLVEFDAVDTGLFVCPEAIFSSLEAALRGGDCSLSDGVRDLARRGKARVVDIGHAFWQDVDTSEMLQHAEAWLASRGKGY